MIKNHGAKTAISFSGQAISFDALLKHISFFASRFYTEHGEHAVVFSENRPGYIYAFYSIWKHQAVAIPIDYLATAQEVSYILKDSQPKVVFCAQKTLAVMQEAISLADCNPLLLLIDELEEQLPEETKAAEMPAPTPDQTAVIIYTSGTTGSPKGVMLSYRNLIQNIDAVSEYIQIYKPDSRVLVLLPLHHIFPLMGTMIIPLKVGAMIAISPSMVSSDIMETLQQNKVTIMIGVPRLFAAIRKGVMDKINSSAVAKLLFKLAAKLNSKSFSHKVFGAVHQKLGGAIENLVSGGAALDPAVGRDFQVLGFEVLEGYGMTEAAPMISFTRPGRVRIGSPGEAMPGISIRIVDGEITASGNSIMQGYYGREEETAAVLKDGWLYTGDLGHLDEDGYLFITGRKKEIIVLSNGKNINPAEIEESLLESSLIQDCGVFSNNDQLQLIILPDLAQFEIKDQDAIEEKIRKELIEPFNKSVSGYKKIVQIHLVSEELPRTRLGKLQRFKLKDAVKKPAQPKVETEKIDDPVYQLIAGWIEKEKERKPSPDDHLEIDLGLDSLDKVSLQTYLSQTFGVSPEPSAMGDFRTLLLLSDWINAHKTRMEETAVNWKAILQEKVNLKLPSTWITGQIAMWFSRIFLKLYFRFQAKGTEKIPDGPCIIAPNHQSFFDGMFVASWLRFDQSRKTYFYAKEKHIRQRWLKFLANRNNIIVMDLNNNLKESIQKMAEVLKSNKKLIIFPEGTRTFNGNLGEFKKTFAILSRELNVPIVPVSIKGAFEALPRGSFFPKPWKKISVDFLDPVFPEQLTYEDLASQVKQKIAVKIGAVNPA